MYNLHLCKLFLVRMLFDLYYKLKNLLFIYQLSIICSDRNQPFIQKILFYFNRVSWTSHSYQLKIQFVCKITENIKHFKNMKQHLPDSHLYYEVEKLLYFLLFDYKFSSILKLVKELALFLSCNCWPVRK